MFYEWLTLLNLVEQHPLHRAEMLLWKWERAGGGSRAGGSATVDTKVLIRPPEPN